VIFFKTRLALEGNKCPGPGFMVRENGVICTICGERGRGAMVGPLPTSVAKKMRIFDQICTASACLQFFADSCGFFSYFLITYL
jgi:hypothetical protein